MDKEVNLINRWSQKCSCNQKNNIICSCFNHFVGNHEQLHLPCKNCSHMNKCHTYYDIKKWQEYYRTVTMKKYIKNKYILTVNGFQKVLQNEQDNLTKN